MSLRDHTKDHQNVSNPAIARLAGFLLLGIAKIRANSQKMVGDSVLKAKGIKKQGLLYR